ncbi:diphthine--ammonia ligase [Fictibacillus aquaticus]|uniref:Diphthamide synthase domain-containing protein n=1 Tax=Fictibacillus aquaticus TaxID=2021314 RepID=A0A235FEN0_9BACL|nr:diphthine--ammonia ligase [Fictibacillus aquaticus]OYD59453.1 hypothetical protein CGZ90_06070 [Fictibacillus aquaticus]
MITAISWSGGKDSCMMLDKLVKSGHKAACLITTVPADINRTFGHGERIEAIQRQADALGIPLEFVSCTFETYTTDYVERLNVLKQKYELEAIAFGDLYLTEHREWGEKAVDEADISALYPLWMKEDEAFSALQTFIESGYKAAVIRVRDDKLSEDWLGRELDKSFLQDIAREKVCPMGEAGEYHTYVYDGPLFKQPILFEKVEVLQLETTKRLEIAF